MKQKGKLRDMWPLYVMVLPGMIYLLINNYGPTVGLFIAFKKIDYGVGIWKSPWVGLEIFTYVCEHLEGHRVLRHHLYVHHHRDRQIPG